MSSDYQFDEDPARFDRARAHAWIALATNDAHGLYAQFGFGPVMKTQSLMEIRDYAVYRR